MTLDRKHGHGHSLVTIEEISVIGREVKPHTGAFFCQSSHSGECFHNGLRTGQAADRDRRCTLFNINYKQRGNLLRVPKIFVTVPNVETSRPSPQLGKCPRIQRTSKFLFQDPWKQCVTCTNAIIFIPLRTTLLSDYLTQWRLD
jgi:hypothetical protein